MSASHVGPTALRVLACLVVLTSGCLGVLTGSEPFVASASPATVNDGAISGTDFEHVETDSTWFNETVEVGGQERDVRIENHVSTYERPIEVGADGVTFGLFVVAASPTASIAGQGLNPIGRIPRQQLIEQLAGEEGGLRDVEAEDERTLAVLGTDAEVTRFSAVAERSGQEVPVYVEVTRVEDDDDYVIAVGLYPQNSEDTRNQVTALFEGLEH